MSSFKESVGGASTPCNDSMQLSDGESIEIDDKETNTINVDDDANVDKEEGADRKRRGKSSSVWNHFVEVEVIVKGKKVAKHECIHCKRKYSKQAGGTTSHLGRHLTNCPYMKKMKGTDKNFINFPPSASDSVSGVHMSGSYDHAKCRELLARMIIGHELPFSFTDYHGFNVFMKYNNPFYQKIGRATITKECVNVVNMEREKLKKVFKNVDMISLTSDCWTSNQTIGYVCLTAHFIDSDWKMHKYIIAFNELVPPHSGEVISDSIIDTLIKWGIQDKIGTITLDNAANNDRAASLLKDNFQGKGKLHFEGLFFHVRCCAHILNLVVQDGLTQIDKCLIKIRDGVKYLKKSPGRLLKFGEIATSLGIETRRSLCIDVKTRWNSTHRMLESAIHYRPVFHAYKFRDSNFEWCPTDEEWDRAEKVCKLLEVFLDATNLFSGTSYPTANLFLTEIFKVKKEITDAYTSDDPFLESMSVPMYEKFEKYWGEVGVLMTIGSILDPRCKLLSVNFTFEILYPPNELESRVEEVCGRLKFLYDKYANAFLKARAAKSDSACTTANSAPNAHPRKKKNDFFEYLQTRPVERPQKSELEIYLEEPNYIADAGKEFDVLKWWSVNCSKFPILSKMVRDIFCIPLTTVASESAFSAGGRVLDDYRSSLSKDMVEVLVCGADWIKAGSKTPLHTIQQCVEDEENLEVEISINSGPSTK